MYMTNDRSYERTKRSVKWNMKIMLNIDHYMYP